MAQEFTKANRAYFNDLASKYDVKPWQQKLSAQITEEIRSKLDFISVKWAKGGNEEDRREVRLLDYACGTGMVSRALGPYVTRTLGMDLAPAMVAKYNDLARSSNLPSNVAHAIVGNLFSDDPSELPQPAPADGIHEADLYNFDIAAIGLGFHHFHDQERAIGKLAERLKPGGVILIIDWAGDDEHKFSGEHTFPGKHTISVHGFSEARMKEIFERQGLVEVGHVVIDEPVKLEMDETRPVWIKWFLGRAMKPL